MSFESKLKKSIRRRRLGNKGSRRRRSLMSTNLGPWVIIGSIVLAVAVGGFLLIKFVAPKAFELIGLDWPGKVEETQSAEPLPSTTPHPLENMDLMQLQKEINPNGTDNKFFKEMKYVSDPMMFGDEVLLCGGIDSAGGPRNANMYIYNTITLAYDQVEGIDLENDDIFFPQMSEHYIVWMDHKREGGGLIKAMDRETKNTFVVKEYYVGKPTLHLEGNFITWGERTGSYMDKIYLFDLKNQESTTLDMLERSPFGMSAPWISQQDVVWANYDSQSSSEDQDMVLGSIYSVRLDGMGGAPDEFITNTYVHDPMSNGNVRIWSDANNAPNAKLYMSENRGKVELIAENITGYGIGSDFIAYCKNEQIHVYLLGEDRLDKIITPEGERCMFIGVSHNTIFWYERGVSDRDILKYARLDIQQTPDVQNTPDMQGVTAQSETQDTQ